MNSILATLNIFLAALGTAGDAPRDLACPAGTLRIEGRLGFDLEERCIRRSPDGMAIQHGPFIWWFSRSKGIKRLEGAYVDDRENGVWTRYYENPAGQKSSELHYVNGVLEGSSRTWYPNGQLATEMFYKHGKLDGKTMGWEKDGRVSYEKTYLNGEAVSAATALAPKPQRDLAGERK